MKPIIKTFAELNEFVSSQARGWLDCQNHNTSYFKYMQEVITSELESSVDNGLAARELVISMLLARVEVGVKLGFFEEAGKEVDLDALWMDMM